MTQQFLGSQATCELMGAKTYDCSVGYCETDGTDFGSYMMNDTSFEVWDKYDVSESYRCCCDIVHLEQMLFQDIS